MVCANNIVKFEKEKQEKEQYYLKREDFEFDTSKMEALEEQNKEDNAKEKRKKTFQEAFSMYDE